jgi:hypothetical protein
VRLTARARYRPSRRIAEGGGFLGCCALDRLLVEDALAAGAHLLLDLVRDACPLQKHMDALRNVLVELDGLPLTHLVLTVVAVVDIA